LLLFVPPKVDWKWFDGAADHHTLFAILDLLQQMLYVLRVLLQKSSAMLLAILPA
jgi:hypothetical protein